MTTRSKRWLVGVAALLGALVAVPAQAAEEHAILAPQDVKWGSAPVLPPGVEIAVVYGAPSEAGPFAYRLKFSAGSEVAPHTHPIAEVVTVLSGTVKFGMGEMADRDKTEAVEAGSLVVVPPEMPHYVFADEETIIQVNGVGPTGITYVNPEDDPRRTQ